MTEPAAPTGATGATGLTTGMISLVIAGSRSVTPTFTAIEEAVIIYFAPTPVHLPVQFIREVVSGDALGADSAGASWARSLGIPVWHEPITEEDMRLGKYIGPRMRNRRMADRGDAAIIFWDGISGGSSDMACRMLARNKLCYVVPTKKRRAKNPRKKDEPLFDPTAGGTGR